MRLQFLTQYVLADALIFDSRISIAQNQIRIVAKITNKAKLCSDLQPQLTANRDLTRIKTIDAFKIFKKNVEEQINGRNCEISCI